MNPWGHISMTKSMLLLIGLFLAVPLGVAEGQQAVPGNQGLIGTPNQALPGNRVVPGNQGPNRNTSLSIDQPGAVAL